MIDWLDDYFEEENINLDKRDEIEAEKEDSLYEYNLNERMEEF